MTDEADYQPDYTEADLQALAQEPRFLAAARAYALDLVPLGQAEFLAFVERPYHRRAPSPLAYHRLFHETARRIRDGRIVAPEEMTVQSGDALSQKQAPSFLLGGPGVFKFSELERAPTYDRWLKRRRMRPNEEDIVALSSDERFLACIDAYRLGLISQLEAKRRLYGDVGDLPRNLSGFAFGAVALEVGQRIIDGRITLPPGLRERHSFAYVPESKSSS